MSIDIKLSVKDFAREFDVYTQDGHWSETIDDPYSVYRDSYGAHRGAYLYHRESGQRAEVIETSGGGEGGAEDCETVLKIGNRYFSITYSYYSHHGFEFDYGSIYEVKPVEVTVTQFQPI